MKKEIKSFVYNGLTFKPLKTLKGKASEFFEISKHLNNIGLTPTGWNYNGFYKIARENNSDNFDLFEVNGKTVIPATNYLFEYK
jgi:hypothetical protein